ncbi:MAG TPA: hypothetical protein VF549_16475 [Solirubrobacteraceae bacterium]|jgi:hypothetical protein
MKKTARIVSLLSVTIALACALSATALARGGGGSGSGGGSTTTTPTTTTGAVTVSSVSIAPTKVAYNTTATGTVRLSRVPDAPFTVSIANDSNNSPVLATTPDSVTITPPASSVTFPIQGGTGMDGRTFAVGVQAYTSTSGATGRFYLVPFADTDLIRIPKAELSPSGDLKFEATTDTASAVLTASFNGVNVPMRNDGGGRWSGQAKVAVSAGDVIVRSNLGGCQARSPFSSGGDHFC